MTLAVKLLALAPIYEIDAPLIQGSSPMLSPIRPLQSTEVRRVDEVTPRRPVAARVPSPFDETNDSVRLSIGDDARRLASGKRDSGESEPDGAETPRSAPEPGVALGTAPGPNEPLEALFQGASLPLAFQSETDEEGFGPDSAEPHTLANRALRAFASSGATAQNLPLRDSAFPEEQSERPWVSEDSSRVPFEVFQRAVTDATAGARGSQTRASFSPMERIFSPPENGGEPYGRPVPFEAEQTSEMPFGSTSSEPHSGVMHKLSKEDVDELIADLNWSLPERYSVSPLGVGPSGTAAA